ncbi:MAG: hypothetical protein CL933_24085 [Deltaproteobacteria bacterium]|nr:hypothetical protein [Deltaproteobacteria bacterium]
MPNDHDRLGLDEWREALRDPLQEALGQGSSEIRVEYLIPRKDVADDPVKLLVSDARAGKRAVVLISSPVEPDLVGSGMRIAAAAKERLGPRLGSVILEPLGQGTLDGLSYTILPFRNPLAEGRLMRRFWRLRLRGRVLDWLAEVASTTAADASAEDASNAFEASLRHLATLETMGSAMRDAAQEALDRLRAGEWKPQFILMHGDLWDGNLLLPSRSPATDESPAPFVLIDWPGATLRGYPLFDLLRITRSMRISESALRREVSRHCQILRIEAVGARGHLLACLGHIGSNLGFFPVDMYTEMSRNCFADLERALGAGPRA